MGLFGGSSKNQTVTTTTTEDRRIASEDATTLVNEGSGDVIYNVTGGEAFDLGEAAIAYTNEGYQAALDAVASNGVRGLDTVQQFANEALYHTAQGRGQALDLAQSALFAAQDGFNAALSATNSANASALDFADRSATSEAANLSTDLMKMAIPALALVLIFGGVLR